MDLFVRERKGGNDQQEGHGRDVVAVLAPKNTKKGEANTPSEGFAESLPGAGSTRTPTKATGQATRNPKQLFRRNRLSSTADALVQRPSKSPFRPSRGKCIASLWKVSRNPMGGNGSIPFPMQSPFDSNEPHCPDKAKDHALLSRSTYPSPADCSLGRKHLRRLWTRGRMRPTHDNSESSKALP